MLYPSLVWKMPGGEKVLYLTFDDGPNDKATPFVLDQLSAYNARASFFCIGKNVEQHPQLYQRILAEGHTTGNHTMHHTNGWKTGSSEYIAGVEAAAALIDSRLFRPPYGRITRQQARLLKKGPQPMDIIMWSVLSGDFDVAINGQACLDNVLRNAGPGSIIVFHDSDKAWDRMSYALPKVLQHFSEQGYVFKAL